MRWKLSDWAIQSIYHRVTDCPIRKVSWHLYFVCKMENIPTAINQIKSGATTIPFWTSSSIVANCVSLFASARARAHTQRTRLNEKKKTNKHRLFDFYNTLCVQCSHFSPIREFRWAVQWPMAKTPLDPIGDNLLLFFFSPFDWCKNAIGFFFVPISMFIRLPFVQSIVIWM